MIYLDNNATTKPAPEAIEAARPWFDGSEYGNPSAGYNAARQARDAIEQAREECASAFGCDPIELVFTSGASESIVSAFTSALENTPSERNRIVTSTVEHSCVLGVAEWFSERGYTLDLIDVDQDGRLDLAQLKETISEETALVSLMSANNEVGNIYPIAEIAEFVKGRGALLHVDAVQAVCKIPVNLHQIPGIDYASFSTHKFHGLKGTGALYLRRGTSFRPLLLGGHQEKGRRAGTENVAGIVAMGAAAKRAAATLEHDIKHERELRDRFEQALLKLGDTKLNGDATTPNARVPNTTNISFLGVEAEELLMLLDSMGLAASAGSACTTGSLEPSHVLRAMKLSDTEAQGALRFSLSRYTTHKEIDQAIEIVTQAIEALRPSMPS